MIGSPVCKYTGAAVKAMPLARNAMMEIDPDAT